MTCQGQGQPSRSKVKLNVNCVHLKIAHNFGTTVGTDLILGMYIHYMRAHILRGDLSGQVFFLPVLATNYGSSSQLEKVCFFPNLKEKKSQFKEPLHKSTKNNTNHCILHKLYHKFLWLI